MADSGHDIGTRCHNFQNLFEKDSETSSLWLIVLNSTVVVNFLVGAPPVIVVSSACAGLAGLKIIFILLSLANVWRCNRVLAQLASSSYYGALHSSQPPQDQEKNKEH